MHFHAILGEDQLSKVLNGQLFKSKEAYVAEDLVENLVVAICTNGMLFKKDLDEYLQKVLISDATIEQLFDEHFLIWVFEMCQKIISMRVNSIDYRVERLYTFIALFNELGELHLQLLNNL